MSNYKLTPATYESTTSRLKYSYIYIANIICLFIILPSFYATLIAFPNSNIRTLLSIFIIFYIMCFTSVHSYYQPVNVVQNRMFVDINDPILHQQPIYDTTMFV